MDTNHFNIWSLIRLQLVENIFYFVCFALLLPWYRFNVGYRATFTAEGIIITQS
jgi:hypothetical protein